MNRFKRAIKSSLYRCKKLRELNAPRILVRNEQLFLWCLRRMRIVGYDPKHVAPCDVPGFKSNYHKFIKIHEEAELTETRHLDVYLAGLVDL